MSQENVEAFKRGAEAVTRQDLETLLDELDPEVEWHSAILMALGGNLTVYRGHEGIRNWLRDLSEALVEIDTDYPEIRDLGDRIVALGRVRVRGRESGAEDESPIGAVTDFRNGKAIRVRTYLDHKEALVAAGLGE
jgi:ketosteroid isomerase-like protein